MDHAEHQMHLDRMKRANRKLSASDQWFPYFKHCAFECAVYGDDCLACPIRLEMNKLMAIFDAERKRKDRANEMSKV